MTPICAIDTETDGIRPARQVWEVAMIRRDDRGQTETQFFVDIDLSEAEPMGLQVGGFYNRHPYGRYLAGHDFLRPSYTDGPGGLLRRHYAAEEVARWTHGAHLVGAVPSFDADVLDKLLRDYGLIPAWHYHLIDIEAMAVGYLNAISSVDASPASLTLPWRSDDLSHACGVEPPSDEGRHTAYADASWALRWFDTITGGGDG